MSRRVYKLKTGEEIRWFGNHHGFVLVYAGRNEFGQRCYEIRKLSKEERRAIVFSYLKDHEDEYVKVSFLSEKLGVTDRAIQSDIRFLENCGTIKRIPVIGVEGKQRPNRYQCIAPKSAGPHVLTLENLYKPSNPAGIRTWSWEDYRMETGKTSQELYDQYMDLLDEKQEQNDEREKALKKSLRQRTKEEPEM